MKTVAVAVLLLITTSCGTQEPSHTRVMCDQWTAAFEGKDIDAMGRALNAMLDLGTEEDPTAVEPEVYIHAYLLARVMNEYLGDPAELDFELDALNAECAKVER